MTSRCIGDQQRDLIGAVYWENNASNFNAVDISLPTAITVFPGEIYRAPRSWSERAYHKLIYSAGRQGRHCGVGTARTIQQRNPGGVQIAASIDLRAVPKQETGT